MIRFEKGSGRYESEVQLFHFNAVDDRAGEIRCVISLIAVEDLTGDAYDGADPIGIFQRHEDAIFSLAEQVYVLRGLNERGVLAVASNDTLMPPVL